MTKIAIASQNVFTEITFRNLISVFFSGFSVSSPLQLDSPLLNLELPDPEEEALNAFEFLERIDKAWSVCDRFDLQTEIWRGRILRVVRDREKRGGDARGAGFLQWLREREISKTRAYSLIQLADSSDELVGGGLLDEASVNNFSKRAFLETAQAVPEVQQMISNAANEGQEITRKQVRRLNEDFLSVTSPLLPDEIRQKTQSNLLPSRVVAPLVKELSKLSESQQDILRGTLKDEPEVDCIKDVTNTARWIAKSTDTSLSLRALQASDVSIEKAMQEAQRLDALGVLSDALAQSQVIESSVLKLYTACKRLGGLNEKLWIESGSSTPYLRDLIAILQTLSGATMRISLGDLAGGKRIRLQMVEESADHLDPPPIP